MAQADSISTTHTDTSRRRFLIFTGAVSAVGAGSLAVAAAVPALPPPTKCSIPEAAAKASPALRDAMLELEAAHEAMDIARARFTADDLKMAEWAKANPEPQGKRAKRRHNRKWAEVREATVRESWNAVIAAEDRFQDARFAVANILPRDQHDLIVKAGASMIFDDVFTAGYLREGLIGQSVANALFKFHAA